VSHIPEATAVTSGESIVAAAELTLTTFVPTIEVSDHHASEIAASVFTLDGLIPECATSEHHISEILTQSLSLTGQGVTAILKGFHLEVLSARPRYLFPATTRPYLQEARQRPKVVPASLRYFLVEPDKRSFLTRAKARDFIMDVEMIKQITKKPGESFWIGLDYSGAGRLPDGATLASSGSTIQAIESPNGADVTADFCFSSIATVQVSNSLIKAWIQNGTSGKQYIVTFTVRLSTGEVLQESIPVAVRD
jgi:hypothetical protein